MRVTVFPFRSNLRGKLLVFSVAQLVEEKSSFLVFYCRNILLPQRPGACHVSGMFLFKVKGPYVVRALFAEV